MEQEQKPAGGEPVAPAVPAQPKKSNTGKIVLIIVAVIVGLMIVAMVGGYFIFKSVKSKISEKIGENTLEKVIEKGTGKKVDIETDEGSVNIKTEDGTLTASSKGDIELPKDFPQDIYIPSGAKISYSVLSPANPEDGSKASFMVMYSAEESVSDLAEKYKSEMANNDWKLQSEASYGGTSLNFKKVTRNVTISISENQEDDKLGKAIVTLIGSED